MTKDSDMLDKVIRWLRGHKLVIIGGGILIVLAIIVATR